MTQPLFHALPDGRRIAYRHNPGAGPAAVFLPGYMSDMAGGKATAVFDWAAAQGRECLLLDYSGCGKSEGRFADGTPTRWAEEVVALVGLLSAASVVLIGSSMGGWLMLLAALELRENVHALVGIAAAPDFTDWGYSAQEKAVIAAEGVVRRPLSETYAGDSMPMWQGFWQSGQDNLLLGQTIEIDCPVRLLQGQCDDDVPWDTAPRLAEALRSADVQVTLVKDGDHRLSRDADIALLLRTIAALP
ncbi:MAG: alpha/beta hydrolase [Novosphingobium sp.]|uniref:alpha/beta hydrolase n=1 Tax=Novosphingobium sp. TaxID=1874826 RepID=UPI0032B97DC0